MKVTLVRPPYYSLFGITTPTYPIGLGYLSSYIREFGGHQTSLVDGELGKFKLYDGFWKTGSIANVRMFLSHTKFFQNNLKTMTDVMGNPDHFVWHYLVQEIMDSKPELVGFNAYTTNIESVKNISGLLKAKAPHIPIVVGGPHVSALPAGTLEYIPSVDYGVFGEGEQTFAELLEYCEKGTGDIASINGLVYRKGGAIALNAPREFRSDMDAVPFPDRDLGNRSDYKFDDYLSTSRGCPFACTFCTVNGTWSRKVRYRSTEKIIEELMLLKHRYGTQRVTLIDDTFTLKKSRVMELCQAIIDNGLNDIPFSATSRADTLDEDIIKIMVAAGIKSIRFGIETGSPRIQKLIKKNLTEDKAVASLALCNKYRVDSFVNFMVNHPTETAEDVEMSKELYKKLNPTRGFVCMTMPFPKTPIHDYALSIGKTITQEDYCKFIINGQVVVNISAMTDEELMKSMRDFYALIQKMSLPKKIKLIVKTAMTPKKLIKFFFRGYGVKSKEPDYEGQLTQ